MDSSTQFTGLAMPVFTAFGWAGEEAAIKYALSQLELFIQSLHKQLSRVAREYLPYSGLSAENQMVYLAAVEDVSSDVFVMFQARPLTLEIQLAFTDKKLLASGLKKVVKDPVSWHRLITELGPDWSLRVQQLERNEETGETAHYQDLFKDSVAEFKEEKAAEVMSKAEYLNSDEKWVTPIFLSRRYPSEQSSVMGLAVLDVMSEQITGLIPLITFFTGRTISKKSTPAKSKVKSKEVTHVPAEPEVDVHDEFIYVSELKPLHLRRGFVNMLPEHWPFFAINSRTETRRVTVYYDGIYDKNSAVWRLVSNDQARLVLSPKVHQWLEDTFTSQDKVHVTARKLDDDEIQISLRLAE